MEETHSRMKACGGISYAAVNKEFSNKKFRKESTDPAGAVDRWRAGETECLLGAQRGSTLYRGCDTWRRMRELCGLNEETQRTRPFYKGKRIGKDSLVLCFKGFFTGPYTMAKTRLKTR